LLGCAFPGSNASRRMRRHSASHAEVRGPRVHSAVTMGPDRGFLELGVRDTKKLLSSLLPGVQELLSQLERRYSTVVAC
jgi:hypothetical protein